MFFAENEMNGCVFNIQRFSVNDGPGIRTNVFLKGCPLSCIWCHNPESKKAEREIFFDPTKCITCGKCAVACPSSAHAIESGTHILEREKCSRCGKCADVCPTGAIEAVGTVMSAQEVMGEVMKDRIFYESSGGGITLSGGEPMLRFDFAYEILALAKENGINTCMETCGFAPAEEYAKIAPLVDIFLFDCKETDDLRHREYTGASNKTILENLRMLDAMGARIILRCPIIPTLNDRDEHLAAIAEIANSLKSIIEIDIEPYHPLGASKSRLLGTDYPLSELTFPSEELINGWIAKIQAKTHVAVKRP